MSEFDYLDYTELSDMVQEKASLGFSIDFIRNYIPLLREVIKVKQ